MKADGIFRAPFALFDITMNSAPDQSNMRFLFSLLPVERKVGFALYIAATLLSALLEVWLLVSVMDAAKIFQGDSARDTFLGKNFSIIGSASAEILGSYVAASVGFSVILATLARVGLIRASALLAYQSGKDLSLELLRRSLSANVSYFSGAGSAALLGSTNRIQILSHTVILPILRAITSIFIIIVITATIFWASPLAASSAVTLIGLAYVALTLLLRAKLRSHGEVISTTQDKRITILKDSVGSIREIKSYQNRDLFEDQFREVESSFRKAQAEILFLSQSPRYLIEALGLLFLGVLVFAAAYGVDSLAVPLPAIGALAVGAQRMLPMAQQVFNGWAQYSGSARVVDDLATSVRQVGAQADIQASENGNAGLDWRVLTFEDVSFGFEEAAAPVITSASFNIERGDTVMISGQTGGGKSTLLDLIMGFRPPTFGSVQLDGEILSGKILGRWQQEFSLVPQSIFLIDGTIRENILFGAAPGSDDDISLAEALYITDLEETIERIEGGLDSWVGEGGVRLSGGQRQRISIARAVLRNRPVMVLDEGTSALDIATEKRIIKRLEEQRSDLTMIHITHRVRRDWGYSKKLIVRDGTVEQLSSSKMGEALW